MSGQLVQMNDNIDYLVVDGSLQGFKNGLPQNVLELEDILYGFITPWDELSMLFCKWDDIGFGEIEADRIRMAINDQEFRTSFLTLADVQALGRLEFRANNSKPVTYQEFIDLTSNKRRRSLTVALHCLDREVWSVNENYHKMERQRLSGTKAKFVHFLSEEFSPGEDPQLRKFYSLQYKCWPPPLFIPVPFFVQVLFFVYYSLSNQQVPDANGPVPVDSLVIFRSDKRHQIWRFVLYALVHAGWWHLIFNMTVQLLLGLPLEMIHGSGRVALVYLSGVLGGSLSTTIFDPDVYLVGASGGVYALLAAHVVNVLLNYSHIDCGLCWILVSIFIASCDVAFAIWDRYVQISTADYPVSYTAHLVGALAGLSLGFLLLRSTDQRPCRRWVWWSSLVIYFGLLSFAIIGIVVIF